MKKTRKRETGAEDSEREGDSEEETAADEVFA
jgi:hypothetical protein